MDNAREFKKYTFEEYEKLPEGTRAELIDGEIYNMSPSPLRIHQKLSMSISTEIFNYIKKNNGKCEVYSAPFDVKLSQSTVVIPDISVICDPKKLTDKGCSGAPDWIIEITSSNEVHDYVTKLNLYQFYGVREYWIVDPKRKSVTVFIFGEDFDTKKYDFLEDIPVWIYKDMPNPLTINISKL